jgi:hypothetical protein
MQTDEERRSYANLMFFCYPHHIATNDVSVYTVAKLKEMKRTHEALPVSVHNPDKLVEAVLRIETMLSSVKKFFAGDGKSPLELVIGTPEGDRQLSPELGRMYTCVMPECTLRVMVNGSVACVEQTLANGTVAYYEVDGDGNVKESKFPYPLSEYQLVIPPEMILRQESRNLPAGFIETTYTLKWSRSVRVIKDGNGKLGELELRARSGIDHARRLITVVNPAG